MKSSFHFITYAIVTTGILALPVSGCKQNPKNPKGTQADTAGGRSEQKTTRGELEKQNPLHFLHVNATYSIDFFGKFVIDGSIISSAMMTTYKNIVLEVHFYTSTQTLLGTKQFSLHEDYLPNSRNPFNLKTDGFSGTERLDWTIIQVSVQE